MSSFMSGHVSLAKLAAVKQLLKRIASVAKWIFTPLAIAFLLMAAWQSRLVINKAFEHALPIYFFYAVMAWILAYLIAPHFPRIILNACGAKVTYRQALDLHVRYLPARYIPGGIWHTTARIVGLHALGVRPRQISCFIMLENLIALGTTFSIGGMVVGLHQPPGGWQLLANSAAVLGAIVLVLSPWLVNRVVLSATDGIGVLPYVVAVGCSVIFWILAAGSFLLFMSAFPHALDNTSLLEMGGAYLFSWGVGFVAIFAPQGIGVFEVVAAAIMPAANLPFGGLVVLFAGFRVVVIFADVCMWVGRILWLHLKFGCCHIKQP